MSSLELGVIGNETVAALIDENATINWLCLPRLDGEPIFNSLLGGCGDFTIELSGFVRSEQKYTRNTAILVTYLEAEDGSMIKVTDFAPRFVNRGRMFRPASIVRYIEPVKGTQF